MPLMASTASRRWSSSARSRAATSASACGRRAPPTSAWSRPSSAAAATKRLRLHRHGDPVVVRRDVVDRLTRVLADTRSRRVATADPSGPSAASPVADLAGSLVVDKPEGPTSHDVVGRVRRVLGERRVGHAGTLDPLASGVVVVLVGGPRGCRHPDQRRQALSRHLASASPPRPTIARAIRWRRPRPCRRPRGRACARRWTRGSARIRRRRRRTRPRRSAARAHRLARRGEAVAPAPALVTLKAWTLVGPRGHRDDRSADVRGVLRPQPGPRRRRGARLRRPSRAAAPGSGAFTLDGAVPLPPRRRRRGVPAIALRPWTRLLPAGRRPSSPPRAPTASARGSSAPDGCLWPPHGPAGAHARLRCSKPRGHPTVARQAPPERPADRREAGCWRWRPATAAFASVCRSGLGLSVGVRPERAGCGAMDGGLGRKGLARNGRFPATHWAARGG